MFKRELSNKTKGILDEAVGRLLKEPAGNRKGPGFVKFQRNLIQRLGVEESTGEDILMKDFNNGSMRIVVKPPENYTDNKLIQMKSESELEEFESGSGSENSPRLWSAESALSGSSDDFLNNPTIGGQLIFYKESKNDQKPNDSLNLRHGFNFELLWKKPFPPKQTKNDLFRVDDNEQSIVPFMNQRNYFRLGYILNGEARCILLNYHGGHSLLITMPDDDDIDVDRLSHYMSLKNIKKEIYPQMKYELVDLTMPKFQLFSDEVKLDKDNYDIKLQDSFNSNATTYYGKFEDDTLGIEFYIGGVYQEVEFEEDSPETTDIINELKMSTSKIERYIANRPFVYQLIQTRKGHILYNGVYKKPMENLTFVSNENYFDYDSELESETPRDQY